MTILWMLAIAKIIANDAGEERKCMKGLLQEIRFQHN